VSIQAHPHFHAVNFTVSILAAFKESLRGDARFEEIPHDAILALMVEMTERAEWLANASAVAAIREDGGP
jgi:hypothetical protein